MARGRSRTSFRSRAVEGRFEGQIQKFIFSEAILTEARSVTTRDQHEAIT
ncbi:hypothetical protein RRSWK_02504 [Rhodopirellula sp. SWK7]|nr:hypothetical protein RRSWK_02504 [Rhodopirellula sp. SWK7]